MRVRRSSPRHNPHPTLTLAPTLTLTPTFTLTPTPTPTTTPTRILILTRGCRGGPACAGRRVLDCAAAERVDRATVGLALARAV